MDLDALHAKFKKFEPMLEDMHKEWTEYRKSCGTAKGLPSVDDAKAAKVLDHARNISRIVQPVTT